MSESMRPRKHVAEETRSAMCGRLRVGKAAFQIERTKRLCGSPHHDSNYRGRTGCRHSQLRRDLRPIWPGRVYVLILRTSGGDVDAVTSRNKEFVSNLQKAVEQAFFVRA